MSKDETMTDEADNGAAPSQKRAIIITIVVLAVLFGGLFLFKAWKNSGQQGWQAPPVAVAATPVVPREVPVSLNAVGTLRAINEVVLAPEVAGRVTAIRFQSGTTVAKGALLVQLYDGPERADRRAAQAKLQFAGIQLARSRKLAPSGAEPLELLQQRVAERDQAQAAVGQIDARLVQKQVRAPFSGVLGLRKVNLGQFLNPGDPVATLTALDRLYVEFALPQQEFSRIRPGSLVTVISDSWAGRIFTAKVNAVEPKVGEDTRNIMVQAILANRDGALRPGMYVNAALNLPSQPNALVLPATAIQTSAQGDRVIVIRGKDARKGGKAEVLPVRVDRWIGNEAVISSGIKAGDVVVVEGQLRVQPGTELKVTRLLPTSGH